MSLKKLRSLLLLTRWRRDLKAVDMTRYRDKLYGVVNESRCLVDQYLKKLLSRCNLRSEWH
jgi:hypothetical protein